jgi:hypothetical protein
VYSISRPQTVWPTRVLGVRSKALRGRLFLPVVNGNGDYLGNYHEPLSRIYLHGNNIGNKGCSIARAVTVSASALCYTQSLSLLWGCKSLMYHSN